MGNRPPEDQLLRKLLALGEQRDAAPPAGGEHPDEETLALFAAGETTPAERKRMVSHLAECSACRHIAAQWMRLESDESSADRSAAEKLAEAKPAASQSLVRSGKFWLANPRFLLALAAGVLLAISITAISWPGRLTEPTAYLRAKEQLTAGRFDEVRATIAAAQRKQIVSDRLRSIEAQAIRQIADPVALAAAGRLSDFGYDIGGIAARDLEAVRFRTGLSEASQQLGAQDSAELELLLNRGHVHLTQNDLAAARRDFDSAARLAPENAIVALGQGLVAFLQDHFPAAETAFRKAARLDPANLAARINLAMTLQEQDKTAEAKVAWQELLREDLSVGERAKIQAVLNSLPEPSP